MRQLRQLFSPSNLSQKFATSPDLSPLSPGSGNFLEVPSGTIGFRVSRKIIV